MTLQLATVTAQDCANGCTRPLVDGFVCVWCAGQMARQLRDLPALAVDLDVMLARQTRMGDRGGSRSADQPVPFDPRASEVAADLRGLLVSWSRMIAEERGVGTLPTDTVAGLASWLRDHVEWLRHHTAGHEAVAEVDDVVRRARRLIDRPADRQYVGVCDGQGATSAPLDDEPCGYEVFAKPRAAATACVCGYAYDVEARRRQMLASLEDHLGNSTYVAMVATGLGVKVAASTVRMWVKRHKLQPRTYTKPDDPAAKPKPLYRVGDVVAVAARVTP